MGGSTEEPTAAPTNVALNCQDSLDEIIFKGDPTTCAIISTLNNRAKRNRCKEANIVWACPTICIEECEGAPQASPTEAPTISPTDSPTKAPIDGTRAPTFSPTTPLPTGFPSTPIPSPGPTDPF